MEDQLCVKYSELHTSLHTPITYAIIYVYNHIHVNHICIYIHTCTHNHMHTFTYTITYSPQSHMQALIHNHTHNYAHQITQSYNNIHIQLHTCIQFNPLKIWVWVLLLSSSFFRWGSEIQRVVKHYTACKWCLYLKHKQFDSESTLLIKILYGFVPTKCL